MSLEAQLYSDHLQLKLFHTLKAGVRTGFGGDVAEVAMVGLLFVGAPRFARLSTTLLTAIDPTGTTSQTASKSMSTGSHMCDGLAARAARARPQVRAYVSSRGQTP